MSCYKLDKILNEMGITTTGVQKRHIFNDDYYIIGTSKCALDYFCKQLGFDAEELPRFPGDSGSCFAISIEDGDRLIDGCGFNFLDALGESNREELIKKQLIVNGNGNKYTRVEFKKGDMVLLYNTNWSSDCIANALNICADSVVDVSADSCGALKMIILLDRVGKHTYKPGPMPSVKVCEFDLHNAICEAHSDDNIKRRLISCGVANKDTYVDVDWDNLVVIQDSTGTCEEIAEALYIPKKAITKLYGEYNKPTQVIMLDRVFRKVISKECD